MAYKTFANGFPLPASDLNNYLMNQSVIVFADASARSTALSSPVEGMVTYLESDNQLYKWTGADWENIAPESVITTQGDLIIGDVGGDESRLAIGAANTVLTSNGTTATWATIETPDSVITTEGDLIIGDASGDAARLGIGSNGQVLQSNGTTATWATPAGGSTEWTLLTSGSVPTGAATATIAFTSGYDRYAIFFQNLSGNNSATWYWQFQSGATVQNNERFGHLELEGGGSGYVRLRYSTSGEEFLMYLSGGSINGNAVFEVSGASQVGKAITTVLAGPTSNIGGNFSVHGYSAIANTGALDTIKLRVDQGTIDLGNFYIYGA